MKDNKVSIVFILPSLSAGGAERVMSYIAQKINKNKFNATLIILGYDTNIAFDVTDINLKFLNKPRVLFALFAVFRALTSMKPQIVVSTISHLNTAMGLISIFFRKIKFIGREVNISSVLSKFPEENNRYYPPFLNKIGYQLLDHIICQSNDMYEELKRKPHIKNSKLVIINNPISTKFTPKKELAIKRTRPSFITVGSLEPRKGHTRILKVLKSLDFDFEYTIIGDGSMKEEIMNLSKSLKIHHKIKHIPFTKEVAEHLSNSDLFLQGSYVEGFPNSLLESCAVGTPVIAFNAPGGIDEIIIPGVNGHIAVTELEYEKLIRKSINKTWNPKAISESVYNRYNDDLILSKYENLFLSCAR